VFLVNAVRCQVEISEMGRSVVQRNHSKCCVSECDPGTLTRGRPRPTRAVDPFIHLVVCPTTGPCPLPKLALHIVPSIASSSTSTIPFP
jgi:hypothetical protein